MSSVTRSRFDNLLMTSDHVLLSATIDEDNRAQRLEMLGLSFEPRTVNLDRVVDSVLSRSETLEDAARVLYNLLDGTYSVWPDGTILNIRALVAHVGRLRIEIRLNEHAPPHFHVIADDTEAAFTILTCELLNGAIDRGHRRLVERWHSGARRLLIRKWNETRPSDCPVGPIEE
jgi:hypothetical protein